MKKIENHRDHLDLEPDVAEAFEKLAQQQNCTPSEYISIFLIEYVEKREKEPQS